MKLVVTDITRFKDNDNVCMALLDVDSCKCHRPLPYATKAIIEQKGISPGMIVDATVIPNEAAVRPHVEDCLFVNDLWLERMDEVSFKDLLERSAVDSVKEAFGGMITSKERNVPVNSPTDCSIRTIRINPLSLSISVVGTREQKLRLSFTDKTGETFRHTPIADLNFHSCALKYVNYDRLEDFNTALAGGEEVFMRVGLSRGYTGKNGKQGYWMQANGIYCFPGCFWLEECHI